MIKEKKRPLYLDGLKYKMRDLTKVKASMMKEACVWCLLKCGHANGVQLDSTICDDLQSLYQDSLLL